MRWIFRIVLVLLLASVVYLFWPRTASLSNFDPDEMARVELTIWKKQMTQQFFRRTLAYYGLFFGQYDFMPFTALHAAGQLSWTSAKCKNLEIDAEFDQMVPSVEEVYVNLGESLGRNLPANVLARYQVEIWRQAFTPGEVILTDPYIGFLTDFYEIGEREAEPIAVSMAEARAIFCENEDALTPEIEDEIKALLTDAYGQLHDLLAERSDF